MPGKTENRIKNRFENFQTSYSEKKYLKEKKNT